ncbi:hypothetical protein Nepgr_020678 [Nepenthes gracilis]|uniref:Uncharacterized protein n=1 Tax=Nepenthes gracilis TaxID=150966 RepID=A0AAD3XV97_NEPGR|nr:hypothetical protein Nepgr_020678 [Nepenthes gracilis]
MTTSLGSPALSDIPPLSEEGALLSVVREESRESLAILRGRSEEYSSLARRLANRYGAYIQLINNIEGGYDPIAPSRKPVSEIGMANEDESFLVVVPRSYAALGGPV